MLWLGFSDVVRSDWSESSQCRRCVVRSVDHQFLSSSFSGRPSLRPGFQKLETCSWKRIPATSKRALNFATSSNPNPLLCQYSAFKLEHSALEDVQLQRAIGRTSASRRSTLAARSAGSWSFSQSHLAPKMSPCRGVSINTSCP